MILAASPSYAADKAAAIFTPAPVTAWIKAHAIPVGPVSNPPDANEAAAIHRLVHGADVVGLGEPEHGGREPLAYRNRLIRFLVTHEGVTAVILESGLAQGRRVNDFVMGGPGDATAIAHDGLSWGFGDLQANVDLMLWLRAYNADTSHRAVHFYGADASGGDDKDSFAHAGLVLEDLIAFLAQAAPERSADLRERLAAFLPGFTPEAYIAYTPADRGALSQALADADAFITALKPAVGDSRAADAHDWAIQETLDALRLVAIFQVWPKPGDDPLPADMLLSEIRDRTMADHLLWLLHREGRGGRVLFYAHDGHISAARVIIQHDYPTLRFPRPIGVHLRATLGDRYRAILTSSARNGEGAPLDDHHPGTVDAALATGASAPFLIDIRDAPKSGWWGRIQTLRAGFQHTRDIVPTQTADGFLFLGPLTCEPVTHAVINECRPAKPGAP